MGEWRILISPPELKVQMSIADYFILSVICPNVCLSVIYFYHISNPLKQNWPNTSQRVRFPVSRKLYVISNEGGEVKSEGEALQIIS